MGNWIKEAKEHFDKNGGKDYVKNDESDEKLISKSKEINERLRNTFETLLKQHEEITLNKQGSKWNLQGQSKLREGIWYRAYYEKFGRNYPIVLGMHIGKNGLNISIQIYNDVLGDLSLSEMLGKVIEENAKDKGLNSKEREDEKEKYKDFGFFGIDKEEDIKDKFKTVANVYKEIVYKINEDLLDKTLEEFYQFLKEPKDIKHLSFDENGEFYQKKIAIKNNLEKFLKEPTYKNLDWWDESINSANMQGNRTNLIKKFEGLTLDEVKALKDDSKLQKIKEVFQKIYDLIYDSNGKIKKNLSFKNIEDEIKKIDDMEATARELAYYIQMEEDKIPLVNNMTTDVIKHIEKTTNILNGKTNLQEKIDTIKNMLDIPDNFTFKNYYVIDQFFNLLHKITLKDVKEEKNYKELYQYAYIFANLLGKADKKGVQKYEFIDLLKRGKNIIFYGAPGTGKTYTIRENIENLVKDEYKQKSITQFHPSYGYEDFIEGIKPSGIDDNGNMKFELKNGEFKEFCIKAQQEEENFLKMEKEDFTEAINKYGYFFFVDEINRAELSRVFGELLYALEYRGKKGKIKTQYSYLNEEDIYFYIPQNLFFIGTMNDVDRSIDSFDLALRRRFVWVKKECDYEVLKTILNDKNIDKYIEACKELNDYVINKIDGLDDKYQIGHSYFLEIKNYIKTQITQTSMNDLFEYHIEPLLQEYLRSIYDEKDIKKHISDIRKKFRLNNDKNS